MRGRAADRARTKDVPVDGIDVFFDFVLLDVFARVAATAFEQRLRNGWFERFGLRKVHRPEVRIGIDERDAVNVASGFSADLANESNLAFLGGSGKTERQDIVRRKAVTGNNAGAVAAEHHGFRLLHNHFSRGVGAKEDNVQFHGNTSASALSFH